MSDYYEPTQFVEANALLAFLSGDRYSASFALSKMSDAERRAFRRLLKSLDYFVARFSPVNWQKFTDAARLEGEGL